MTATWTLFKPLDLSSLDFLSGDAAPTTSIADSSHYRQTSGRITLDLFGRGLLYDDDDDLLPFGDIFRIDLFDALDQALQVLDVVWDLLHILSYYNPLTDHWDSEGLFDYLFNEVDWFEGSEGDDGFSGRAGDDVLNGHGGIDTAHYRGVRADYTLLRGTQDWTLADGTVRDGTDRLAGVERLQFEDTAVALDLAGHAGTVARLIGALFGPSELARADLVGIGLRLLDGGMSDSELAELAVASPLFAAKAGSHGDADFVRQVWRNVTGEEPGSANEAHYMALLASGAETQASLALWASQTELLAQRIDLVGLADSGIAFEAAG